MPKLVDKKKFIADIRAALGSVDEVSRQQITEFCESTGASWPAWFTQNPDYRAGRGLYSIAKVAADPTIKSVTVKTEPVESLSEVAMAIPSLRVVAPSVEDVSSPSLIPNKVSGYVPFGHYEDVRTIIKSKRFYPLYITGLSGNGKTMMIEQVCAAEQRECVRVNITIETDESDLLGGFTLQNGQTVWQNGPVIQAMERGAILLLDECDLGSNKLLCLQPVLEGNGVYLKKINKLIKPAPGFNVVATANTKGKGSDDGRFIGTNVMNEAFLERFSVTLEQEYPAARFERRILNNVLEAAGVADAEFVDKLVNWADLVRKTFYEGAVSEVISTRRLVHICEAYGIFGKKREKAIELCLNRFDIDTKNAFLDLYKKLDETIAPAPAEVQTQDGNIPF